MRRSAPLLALVVALVAPLVPPAATSAAAPPTAVPAAAPQPRAQAEEPDVVLTLADDGATRTVTAGQTVLVALAAPDVTRPWQGPVADGPLRLTEYEEHADWYGRPETRALLTAASGGTARLSAATDPACLHDVSPCTEQPRRWSATVVVLGPSPTASPSAAASPSPPRTSCAVQPGPDPEVLTAEDAGASVTVAVGEVVVVGLLACDDDLWSVPVADGPSVRRTSPRVSAPVSEARFVGGRPGTAVLSAQRGGERWSATVTVVAGDCVRVGRPDVPSVFSGGVPSALPPPVVGDTVISSWAVTGTFRSARVTQVGYRRTSARSTTPLTAAEAGAPVDLPRPGEVTPGLRLRTSSRVWVVVDAVCQDGTTRRVDSRSAAELFSPSPVVTLAARRLAVRDYVFSGRVTGGVPRTVLLYRSVDDGDPVLLARTASTASGAWQLRRRFLGTGRLEVYAETVGDTVLRPGRSDYRPTLVH